MQTAAKKIHSDYARDHVDGQGQTFGAWAKRLLAVAATVAPQVANVVDLSNWKHCDELFGFFRDKLSPEQAAASPKLAAIDWKARS